MKHMNNARPKQVSGTSQGWKQRGPNMGGKNPEKVTFEANFSLNVLETMSGTIFY